MGWRIGIAGLVALLAAGCATFTYDTTKDGDLRGELAVVWVGPDRFVYVGGPNGLAFRTSDGQEIKPAMMYTDGGSIPRPVRAVEGFSPWGYAPAYIVHDWLFIQRHCDPAYLEQRKIDFAASARILAEVTKVLMKKGQVPRNDFAFEAISWAVSTDIARKAWDAPDRCGVSAEDRRRVEEALADESDTRSIARALGRAPAKAARAANRPQIVFRRSF